MARVTGKGETFAETSTETDQTDTQPTDTDQLQFPSLVGDPGVEVAERTIDGNEPDRFQKAFVVGYPEVGGDPTEDEDNRSRQAVLREAINLGLHPTEEATFDGAQVHPDGTSTIWHYSVPVTPAAIDHEPQLTVTPAHSEHQPTSD